MKELIDMGFQKIDFYYVNALYPNITVYEDNKTIELEFENHDCAMIHPFTINNLKLIIEIDM